LYLSNLDAGDLVVLAALDEVGSFSAFVAPTSGAASGFRSGFGSFTFTPSIMTFSWMLFFISAFSFLIDSLFKNLLAFWKRAVISEGCNNFDFYTAASNFLYFLASAGVFLVPRALSNILKISLLSVYVSLFIFGL
jgi:hypothetical protein